MPIISIKKAIIIAVLSISICGCKPISNTHKFTGEAIGTYYSIAYVGKENLSIKTEIDSILKEISHNFSIFDVNSNIYKINHNILDEIDDEFAFILEKSLQISRATDGAFDPTIAPLVEYWGFGKTDPLKSKHKQAIVDSLLTMIGYKKISVKNHKIIKQSTSIQLNFNAIAKGYAVDKIAGHFANRGYKDFLIEIGGEVIAKGNKDGKDWVVGIQIPTKNRNGTVNANYLYALQNKATATSGNYRNYMEEEGQRYSHIIDPHTGIPEKSPLLSVSVIANDCMTADAYATAFMVMGLEKSLQFLALHPELSAYFIYEKEGKYAISSTENFPKSI